MKLKLNAIREVLLYIEETHVGSRNESAFFQIANEIETKGLPKDCTYDEIVYATEKLIESGYIKLISRPLYQNGNITMARIHSLTMDGHNLLGDIRKPEIWDAVKQYADEQEIFSIKTVAHIAHIAAKEFIENPDSFTGFLKWLHGFKKKVLG